MYGTSTGKSSSQKTGQVRFLRSGGAGVTGAAARWRVVVKLPMAGPADGFTGAERGDDVDHRLYAFGQTVSGIGKRCRE